MCNWCSRKLLRVLVSATLYTSRIGKIAKKYRSVISLPAPMPKCSSTTSVMSPERPDNTKRVRPRWAKNVIGKASTARISKGQKPPTPALIGRNKVPAPIAVPYRPSIQVVSNLFQPLWAVSALRVRSTAGFSAAGVRTSVIGIASLLFLLGLTVGRRLCAACRGGQGMGLSIPPSSRPGRPVKSLCICRACRRRCRAWCGSPGRGK
ncbi:hypothetical protein D3C84_66590 [compost metagenome]